MVRSVQCSRGGRSEDATEKGIEKVVLLLKIASICSVTRQLAVTPTILKALCSNGSVLRLGIVFVVGSCEHRLKSEVKCDGGWGCILFSFLCAQVDEQPR